MIAGNLYRDRAIVVAIQQQRQSRRGEEGVGLRGLDAADDVDRLGVVGHLDDVAVAEVLVQAGGHAQRIGEVVDAAQFAVHVRPMPVIPFVHGDGHGMRIEQAELGLELAMPLRFLANGILQQSDVPGDGQLLFLPGRAAAIEVLGNVVHGIAAIAEHPLRPADLLIRVVLAVEAAEIAHTDQLDRGVHRPHGLRDAVVLLDVMAQLHEAELPGAEHLVANAPVLDAVGRPMAILRSPPAADGTRRTVAVLDLLGGRVIVAESRIDGNHRFGADLPTEIDEVVESEVVVLHAGPGGVLARRSAVAIADPVAPVVPADEVAARPAIHRRAQLLEQRERIGPHAANVVGRHQGGRADHHITVSDVDLQHRLVRAGPGGELQWISPIPAADPADPHDLAAIVAFAPDQCDIHERPRFARGEPDVADIVFAFDHRQVALADAGARLDSRRVRADEGVLLDHRHRIC